MKRLLGLESTDRPARLTTLAAVTLGFAVLALVTPFGRAEFPAARVGGLLGVAAAIEVLHALRRSTPVARRQATAGAIISMLIALFLINAPFVAPEALRPFVAGWLALDAARYAMRVFRNKTSSERTLSVLATLGNGALALLILISREWGTTWVVAVAGAGRIFGIAWNIMAAPVYTTTEADETVVTELGLSDTSEAVAMASEIEGAEHTRAPIDRGWILSFIATLFAIHIGRMRTDLTFLGLVSPAVAVLGDMAVAVLLTLFVINPAYLLWRAPTRWIERRMWRGYLRLLQSGGAGWISVAVGAWLRWRMRFAIRMRAARYSVPTAISQGLQIGLPFAAVVAATVPIWGMSWYFDTENWAAGMWNSWAESRTDNWREAMVRAVQAGSPGTETSLFAVQPPGVGPGDFSFIVIGDTGEGDASQHVLRDQLLAVAGGADLRFVVI